MIAKKFLNGLLCRWNSTLFIYDIKKNAVLRRQEIFWTTVRGLIFSKIF